MADPFSALLLYMPGGLLGMDAGSSAQKRGLRAMDMKQRLAERQALHELVRISHSRVEDLRLLHSVRGATQPPRASRSFNKTYSIRLH